MDKQRKIDKEILIFAMRYALGRQTYAPSVVIDNIKNNIDLFEGFHLKLMIKEIEEQADFGYGMECDKRTWLGFKGYLEDKVNQLHDEKYAKWLERNGKSFEDYL